VPKDVVRQARKKLLELESNSVQGGMQGDLFATASIMQIEPEPHPLQDALAGVDPDELTAREAHDLLYRLCALL
jgi:DNA mismatch repair protein MutS